MSRSSPRPGRRGSPASETARTGHGFGFAWAKRKKSWASALGRITRFAWTLPGASPAVGPAKSRERIRSRSRLPASTLRSDPRSIVWFLISNSTADWTRAPSYAELASRHSAGGWITYRWRRWFDRRDRHRLRRLDDRTRSVGVRRRLGRRTRWRVRRRVLSSKRRANQGLKN